MTAKAATERAPSEGNLDSSRRGWPRDAIRVMAKSVFAAADLFTSQYPGPRILIYHQIAANPTLQMSIDPATFATQLEWMRRVGDVVSLEDALATPDVASSERTSFVLTFDDGYSGLYEHVFPVLRDAGIPFTLYVTSGHVDGTHSRPEPELSPLTWDAVRDMLGSGLMTVGAHTHTHPDLRGLSPDEVEHELEASDAMISSETGVEPRHFAYPKGYWSATAEPVVRRRYDSAVLGGGAPVTSATDHHRVCRVPVQLGDGEFFFRRKVVRGMRLEEWARSRMKGYTNPSSDAGGVDQ